MEPQTRAFWSRPAAEVLAGLETTPAGLSAAEAAFRLTRYASRRLVPKKRTDAVLRVPVAGGEVQSVSDGIDGFMEPAGLHRARNADTFIWADSAANGGGTVYVINKQP